jgi:phosphotransferase system enzyme I (PtsI)
VRQVADNYAKVLMQVNDDYLRERVADVKDVARRILRNLSGRRGSVLERLQDKHVVVANDLSPSETAVMRKDLVLGFCTDLGSYTSHTAIMARALEIPAVVALGDVSARVAQTDQVLIDGTKGVVILNPTPDRLAEYGKLVEAREIIRSGLRSLKDRPAETRDGQRVIVSANIELLDEIPEVRQYGAAGVGLYRSEYLYISNKELPSEDEQFEAYEKVAASLAPQKVIIRTFDLGGDKFLPHLRIPQESNPFLGFRAIRFSLAHPDIFKTQLRAILRASSRGNVSLMYPMVSSVTEVIQANAILEEAKHELRRRKTPFDDNLEVGIMIEIPSAAMTAEALAEHAHFFSLGTNDLVQYTIAVDRVNDKVAGLYQPTHPAVLRLIDMTIRAGHARGRWVGVCGEMAGNPLMTPLLVGLGIDELSMMPAAVLMVKDVLRSITHAEACQLAEEALKQSTAAAVSDLCRKLVARVAPDLLELMP